MGQFLYGFHQLAPTFRVYVVMSCSQVRGNFICNTPKLAQLAHKEFVFNK
jgi:hypothetical protein